MKTSCESKPVVSVVVPVYNAGCYLDECLRSLASQTMADMEVLMVNDCSTDSSRDICMRFAETDSRFRLIDMEANEGVSAARNRGIGEACGKYVFFIDADDILHPVALERLTRGAESTGAKVAVCAFQSGVKPIWPTEMHESMLMSAEDIVEDGLYQKFRVNNPIWFVRRELFEADSRMRFSEGRRFEDLEMFYRLFLSVPEVLYIPDALYFYRTNAASFINTFSPSRLDVLDVTDNMLGHIRIAASPRLTAAARDRRFSAHFNVLTLLLAYGEKRPETEARCLKVIKNDRLRELCDSRVRLKNKLGALASYGGMPMLRMLVKLMKIR